MSNDHVYLFCEWLSIDFTGEKRDVVKIRGPKEDVDKCHKHLMKIVKELNESSYVSEVPIYKQFHKFVIGKGGANIRKVRIRSYVTQYSCLYSQNVCFVHFLYFV